MTRALPPLFGAANAAVDNALRRTKLSTLVETIA
jgi:hypothetical protein